MAQQSHSRVYTPKNWKQILRHVYTSAHIHNATIRNSQKVETAWMLISKYMDKPTVLETYSALFFSHRKECVKWMNLRNTPSDRNRSHIVWSCSYEISRRGQSPETESSPVARRRGRWGNAADGHRLSFWGNGAVLERDGELEKGVVTWCVTPPNATEVFTWKWLIFMQCECHLNFYKNISVVENNKVIS